VLLVLLVLPVLPVVPVQFDSGGRATHPPTHEVGRVGMGSQGAGLSKGRGRE